MSSPIKPGYKQTEVGVIPEDWEIQNLGSIGRLSTGSGLLKGEFSSSGKIPAIPYTSLYTDFSEIVDYDSIKWFVDDYGKTTRVDFPCVLIASSSNMEINTGKASALMESKPVAIGREVIIFRSDSNCAFISYLLSTNAYRKRTLTLARGTTIKHVYTATFHDYPIAHPSKAEQEAIAEALSDADALIESLEQLIAKKRQIKQGAMQELLTGKKRLPGFSVEWEVKEITELAQVGRGRVISHNEISKSNNPRYPVFSSQTSNRGVMGYLDTFDFEGDYITWTTDGANAGTVFARTGRFNCTNVCGTIKLRSGDHRFIAAALGRVSKAHVSRHLGNPKLMNDIMKRIEIFVPSETDEQTAIATILSDMDAEIAALEAKLAKARQIKQGMMQELLTGNIRLVQELAI